MVRKRISAHSRPSFTGAVSSGSPGRHSGARRRVGNRQSLLVRRRIEQDFAQNSGVQAPADSSKDSNQEEQIEEESRWAEARILELKPEIRHHASGAISRSSATPDVCSCS